MRPLSLALLALLIFASMTVVNAESTVPVSFPPNISAEFAYDESFDSLDAWEEYVGSNGVELRVQDGVYRAYTPNEGFVWGINNQMHTDIILEVQATPMTIFVENGFGVMCRADASSNGDGYYFMVTGTGYFSIRIANGDTVEPLIDWTWSDAIHTGIDQNTIGAACIGNQLSMYVNGELIAQTYDTTFRSGHSGLAVAGTMNGADVAFDNVRFFFPRSI